MTKLGDAYQELVAAVLRVLEPGAQVVAGDWIDGPDGERDMDVAIRGVADEREILVLVECKDHRRPVGVGFVDAFDSKRRDLQAARAILYSNSGFTEQAESKARRVGIELACAMSDGDSRVRIKCERKFAAKRLRVSAWKQNLYWRTERGYELPYSWSIDDLLYQGLPVSNWMKTRFPRLLREHEGKRRVLANYAFLAEHPFVFAGKPIFLHGIGFQLDCVREWVCQTVDYNVTLGLFDVLRRRVIVPNGEAMAIGPFDRDLWEPCDQPPSQELEPDSFELEMTMVQIIREEMPIPDVEALVREREELGFD